MVVPGKYTARITSSTRWASLTDTALGVKPSPQSSRNTVPSLFSKTAQQRLTMPVCLLRLIYALCLGGDSG